MTSTLVIRKTPKKNRDELAFKLPVKAIIARKFFDHDGSCGGAQITIGPGYLEWFEGILDSGVLGATSKDYLDFEKVVEILRNGDSIDLSWEV